MALCELCFRNPPELGGVLGNCVQIALKMLSAEFVKFEDGRKLRRRVLKKAEKLLLTKFAIKMFVHWKGVWLSGLERQI